MIGIHRRYLLVFHLLAGAVETGDGGPVVRPAQPGVAGPELELRDLGLNP